MAHNSTNFSNPKFWSEDRQKSESVFFWFDCTYYTFSEVTWHLWSQNMSKGHSPVFWLDKDITHTDTLLLQVVIREMKASWEQNKSTRKCSPVILLIYLQCFATNLRPILMLDDFQYAGLIHAICLPKMGLFIGIDIRLLKLGLFMPAKVMGCRLRIASLHLCSRPFARTCVHHIKAHLHPIKLGLIYIISQTATSLDWEIKSGNSILDLANNFWYFQWLIMKGHIVIFLD